MSVTQLLPAVIVLSVVNQDKAGAAFHLRPGHSVFIGTSSNCGLPLSGEGVADIHCYVKFEDGRLWVEDWMSKTGTLVNGERISERVEVRLSDVLQVGSNQLSLQPPSQSHPLPAPQPAIAPSVPTDDGEGAPWTPFLGEPTHSPPVTHAASPPAKCEPIAEPASWPEFPLNFECFGASAFEADEDETYDQETISLLRAEIEHLQTALAQRDIRLADDWADDQEATVRTATDETLEPVLTRMQELVEEANRSDERVAMLEELLLAAEVANAAELEERLQLEAWIDDIEQRLAQRDAERQAEVELLHDRLEQAAQMQERLVQQLRQATSHQTVPPNYHEHLEQLQQEYQKSQRELMESQKQCVMLQQRLSQVAEEPQLVLREDRIRLAEEQKQVAKLKLELSSKLLTSGSSSQCESRGDTDADQRIRALREHLLQIHEQEQRAAQAASLAGRLKRLWQRLDS